MEIDCIWVLVSYNYSVILKVRGFKRSLEVNNTNCVVVTQRPIAISIGCAWGLMTSTSKLNS